MNKMLKRPSIPWIIGLIVIGVAIAWLISSGINNAKHLITIWVAVPDNNEKYIPADTKIKPENLKQKAVSIDTVPEGAIQDPKSIIGKYTDSNIYEGQPFVQLAVSDAQTMREIVRRYGVEFDGITVQLDQSDLSTDDVQSGDNVDVLGVFGDGKTISSSFIAENVPVIAVDSKDRKLLIAAKRSDAPGIAKDLAAGKVRVFLDPRPFGVVDTTPVQQDPTPVSQEAPANVQLRGSAQASQNPTTKPVPPTQSPTTKN